MDVGQARVEDGDGLTAAHDQLAAQRHHLLGPIPELICRQTAVTKPPQQGVALSQDALVLAEDAHVVGINLAEHDVEVAAPLGWRAGDKLDIRGRKEDAIELTEHVHCSPGLLVEADALLDCACAGAGRCVGRIAGRWLDQDNIQPRRAPLALDLGADAGKALVGAGVPRDQLALARGAERFDRGEHIQGFEQVGLSLGIVPAEHGYPRWQVQLEPAVGTKIRQAQVATTHDAPDRGPILPRRPTTAHRLV